VTRSDRVSHSRIAEPQSPAGAARVGGNSKLAGTVARYRIDFLIPTEHPSRAPQGPCECQLTPKRIQSRSKELRAVSEWVGRQTGSYRGEGRNFRFAGHSGSIVLKTSGLPVMRPAPARKRCIFLTIGDDVRPNGVMLVSNHNPLLRDGSNCAPRTAQSPDLHTLSAGNWDESHSL
jgi:hypothetical protein